jgi:hypothetical protein
MPSDHAVRAHSAGHRMAGLQSDAETAPGAASHALPVEEVFEAQLADLRVAATTPVGHRCRPRRYDATFNLLTSAYIDTQGFTRIHSLVAITDRVLALRLMPHAKGQS